MSIPTTDAGAPVDIVDTVAKAEDPNGLTLLDRCDRCGAQAFVRTSVLSADDKLVDLLFCGHHFKRYESTLREKAVEIVNETHKINEKPSSSA